MPLKWIETIGTAPEVMLDLRNFSKFGNALSSPLGSRENYSRHEVRRYIRDARCNMIGLVRYG